MSSSGSGAVSISPSAELRSARRTAALGSQRAERRAARVRRLGVRTVALGYLGLLLGAPLVMIFYRTFEHGLAPVWSAVTAPNAVHAFWLSIEVVAIAVPLNTIFGIGIALVLERGRFWGKGLVGVLIDLPFAISPVVVGLSLVLVYGKTGWFGGLIG